MKPIILVLFSCILLAGCGEKTTPNTDLNIKEGKKSSKLSADSPSAQEMREAATIRQKARAKRRAERIAKQTTIDITPSVFDFGEIPQNKPVSTVFIIKNTGDKPLIINRADASCGCTVPKKPEAPILPGKTGELKVTFTSEPYQAGQTIHKTVTITGNFPGEFKKVAITGKVNL